MHARCEGALALQSDLLKEEGVLPKTASAAAAQEAAAESPQSSLVSTAGGGEGTAGGGGGGEEEEDGSQSSVDSDKNILGFRIVAVPQEDEELMVVLKVGEEHLFIRLHLYDHTNEHSSDDNHMRDE